MSAKIIRLPVCQSPTWPDRDRLFSDSVPFTSMCPTCKDSRAQVGYSPWGLLRRLNDDRPIEAFCVVCNQFWPISPQERGRLVEELEQLRVELSAVRP